MPPLLHIDSLPLIAIYEESLAWMRLACHSIAPAKTKDEHSIRRTQTEFREAIRGVVGIVDPSTYLASLATRVTRRITKKRPAAALSGDRWYCP